MSPIVRHSPLYRALTALMLMVFVQGCMHWETAPLAPQPSPAGQDVRVTLQTGDRRVLSGAYIAHDSLMSSSAEPIPLARITRIEQRAVDGAATNAVVATGVLALLVIAVSSIHLPRLNLGGSWFAE